MQKQAPSLGRILVDSRGHTLYLFENDKTQKSTCYGTCAKVWKPLVVTGTDQTAAHGAPLRTTLAAASEAPVAVIRAPRLQRADAAADRPARSAR